MGIIENAKRVIGLVEEKNCKKLDIAISDLIVAPYYEEREKKINYQPTATQLIIISRYLDIIRKKSGQDYYWIYKNYDQKEKARNELVINP